jgi:hypothetical protein
MKLFLPVRGFHDCLKIQGDLNRLVDWCGANSLELNVGKCKLITFSRLRHPFIYWVVISLIVLTLLLIWGMWWTAGWHFLGILMLRSERLWKCWWDLWKYCQVTSSYSRTLYMSLMLPKLGVAVGCGSLLMSRTSIRLSVCIGYAFQGLGLTDMYDLLQHMGWCSLICLETLPRRRSDACVIFVFDVLFGRVGSPNLFSLVNFDFCSIPHSEWRFFADWLAPH